MTKDFILATRVARKHTDRIIEAMEEDPTPDEAFETIHRMLLETIAEYADEAD